MERFKNATDKLVIGAKNKVWSMTRGMAAKKEKGVNAVVIEVGLLVIGIALLLVFRTEISGFITSIVQECIEKCKSLFNIA